MNAQVQTREVEEIREEMQRMKNNQLAIFEGMQNFVLEMKSLVVMEAIQLEMRGTRKGLLRYKRRLQWPKKQQRTLRESEMPNIRMITAHPLKKGTICSRKYTRVTTMNRVFSLYFFAYIIYASWYNPLPSICKEVQGTNFGIKICSRILIDIQEPFLNYGISIRILKLSYGGLFLTI